MTDVIIVGNGLFGCIAAKLCRARGAKVTILSSDEPWAASRAAGCVIAPSWLNSMTKEAQGEAMGVLNELYKVELVEFKTNLKLPFRASRIDPATILKEKFVRKRVASLGNGLVVTEDGAKYSGKVLVAAGIASEKLVKMPKIKALWGASVRFQGQLKEPQLHVYAPYRQAVAFNISPEEVWMGDGTALITKTWTAESDVRCDTTVTRGRKLFKLKGGAAIRSGVRPYVEGCPAGYFDRVSRGTWVSTGGAKNGVALAAYQAALFVKELGL